MTFQINLKTYIKCRPVENEKDLKDVDEEIKKELNIILVTHLDDVLGHALEKKPSPIKWDESEFLKNNDKNNLTQESLVKH